MNYCIDVIIQGGQKTWSREKRKFVGGADYLALRWAQIRGCPYVEEKAQWDTYGKRAGMIRNQAMIDLWSPDATLAFPGGAGTKNMIDISNKAGITVFHASDF